MAEWVRAGGALPRVPELIAELTIPTYSYSKGKFVMEDWHNMGANYDPTLMSWYKNFIKSYPKLDHEKYDERFKRMWEFYLLACAGQFRSRNIQLWQVVYSPHGVEGGYNSVR
jgi:cyclopropane-fatty-acyl-phospholipid synthase